jgi:hypothetical protein
MDNVTNNRTYEVAKHLQEVPQIKEKNNTTPNQLVIDGIYTNEQLMSKIEELIIEGNSYRKICKILNVNLPTLTKWVSQDGRPARMREALRASADYYADMSIQVLKNAPSDKIEIMRAKELSSAYRWLARVRDVSKYGEKLDVTSDGQQIVQLSLGSGIKPPEEIQETTYLDVTDDENKSDQV